jgi:hypothetical protein
MFSYGNEREQTERKIRLDKTNSKLAIRNQQTLEPSNIYWVENFMKVASSNEWGLPFWVLENSKAQRRPHATTRPA